ncbi:MAG TPA: cytochrome c [Pyrinomonadaceae bacterium]|nr:cytochrome c [Pyrinomonadaceae bacterium]
MGSTGKLSVLLLALLAVGATGVGGSRLMRAEASGGAQKKPAGGEPAAAKVLYTQNCTRCHGADGRAETPMGKAFAATNFTDANWWKRERPSDKRLTASIRDGREDMPPFGQNLSKKEIAALAAYVRTFKGK